MSDSSTKTFHHAIVKLQGGDTLLSKAQYDAMPLRDRVKLILQGEVTFYDRDDKIVPANQALMRQKT